MMKHRTSWFHCRCQLSCRFSRPNRVDEALTTGPSDIIVSLMWWIVVYEATINKNKGNSKQHDHVHCCRTQDRRSRYIPFLLSTSPEKDLLIRDDLPPFRVPPASGDHPLSQNVSPFESVWRGMSSDGHETALVHVSRHPSRARHDSNLSLEIMISYVNASCVTS